MNRNHLRPSKCTYCLGVLSGGRQRRQRRRCQPSIISLLLLFVILGMACAFHGRRRKDNNAVENTHLHQHHDRGAFIRSSLQSIAERGASKWGDYVATATKRKSKALTRSSTVYISQLHEKIQKMRSKSAGDSSSSGSTNNINLMQGEKVDNDYEVVTTVPAPSEHFTQEILAAMLGGATAGSAFAAATVGAFAATAIMALGAIVTVFFADEQEENTMALTEEEITSLFDDDKIIGEQIMDMNDAGCDFNGEDRVDEYDDAKNEIIMPTATQEQPSHKLPALILEELMRCYKGSPDFAASLFPLHYSRDICIADNYAHDNMMGTENELFLVEPRSIVSEHENNCSSTLGCKHLLPPTEQAAPKRVEVVWHDKRIGSSNIDDASNPKRILQYSTMGKARIRSDTSIISLTDAERDGALLLAESFRVASSAFGLLASGVRFAGETAAATAGGTARLAGGVVRLSGWAVGSLGEAIENSGSEENNSDREMVSSSSAKSDMNTKNKRKVAGTSVRLLGDAIEQIADSLLLAGSATEHVAFAATGAAEGTLRIMENSFTRISDVFSKEGRRGSSKMISSVKSEPSVDIEEITFVPDGIASLEIMKYTPEESTISLHGENETVSDEVQNLFQLFSAWASQNADLIVSDTVGVPSLAMEILGVFLLCFVASVVLLRPKNSVQTEKSGPHNKSSPSSRFEADDVGGMQCTVMFGNHNESATNNHFAEDDSHTTLTAESTTRGHDFDHASSESMFTAAVKIFNLLLMPLKLSRSMISIAWGVFFRNESSLLVFYLLGWIFLSRSSQYKSSVIQRKSELTGFKLATMSIGKDSPSIESAVWLNSLIHRAWRVKSGGLEPMISSYLSSILAESLSQPYSKSSGVAHVALDAFTLGSSPPMISRIELNGVDDNDESTILMRVDVGILLHDAVLLLDIKPSSLEYRSLPSTKISVNSLDAKATLNLAVKCTPEYPYISFLDVSLVEIPAFNLKIEPQSQSGLKGVDFGSIPILSSWIRSSISSSLAYYLYPQHISIDVLGWLRGDDVVVTYFES